MKHTLELLICSTIGLYCMYRCYIVMPDAIDYLNSVISSYMSRAKDIEVIIEQSIE